MSEDSGNGTRGRAGSPGGRTSRRHRVFPDHSASRHRHAPYRRFDSDKRPRKVTARASDTLILWCATVRFQTLTGQILSVEDGAVLNYRIVDNVQRSCCRGP